MVYNKFYILTGLFLMSCCIPVILISCTNKEKSNTDNTFYIELINFTKDSLKQNVSNNLFGKVAYYKNNKLNIVSLNYVNEEFPDMHYFKSVEAAGKEISKNSKKIRLEFKGNYNVDSISYSMQKFTYKDNQWVKISDMGFVKATTTYKKAKTFAIEEYGKQIVNNTVLYSYN